MSVSIFADLVALLNELFTLDRPSAIPAIEKDVTEIGRNASYLGD